MGLKVNMVMFWEKAEEKLVFCRIVCLKNF